MKDASERKQKVGLKDGSMMKSYRLIWPGVQLASEAEFNACFGTLSNHVHHLNSRVLRFALFR
jgi:hypothetical protein